jgi:hypothetical protein
MTVSSVKCPQCGLVSFATAECCKRCGNGLVKPNTYTLEEAGMQDEKQLGRPTTSAKRRALMVGIGVVVLLGFAFVLGAVRLMRGRLPAQATLPIAEGIAPATLRSEFVEQIRPQTDKLATDLFVLCRDAEKGSASV